MNRSTKSLIRTSAEFLRSRGQEENMYPTDPCSDGRAVIEYEVLKSEFGAFDMEKLSPLGTVKSRMATKMLSILHTTHSHWKDDHLRTALG